MQETTLNDKENWKADPISAFDHFVRTVDFVKLGYRNPIYAIVSDEENALRPLRDSTVNVYKSMFQHFIKWIVAQPVSLYEIRKLHILAFINAEHSANGKPPKKLQSLIRLKYLRLLERTFERMGVSPNPAMEAAIETTKNRQVGKNADSAFLSVTEITKLMHALPEPTSWKRIRDRAILATLVGAGLKPSEVLGLWVENIGRFTTGRTVPITVSAASVGGSSRWHQTQLDHYAVPELQRWIEIRATLSIATEILFPSNLEGAKLDQSTLYRTAKRCFEKAGFNPMRFGGRTLRNTFAVHELEKGTPINELKEFLGVAEDKSMNMYLNLQILGTFRDD